MKKLVIALGLLTLTSCSVFQNHEQRAQNHLKKAISLDPSILKSTDSTRITDSVRLKDSTVVVYKDTTIVTTKDSVIIRPKDSLSADIGNPCDTVIKGKLGKFDYRLGTDVHRIHVWSEGGHIKFTSAVDSLVSTIQSKDTYTSHLVDSFASRDSARLKEIDTLKKTVVTKIKYKPKWYQIVFTGLVFFLIGYMVAKFTNFKLRLPI